MALIGKSLGSYRVTGKIGEGGMGAVYIAEHPLIGRKAAVKVLLPQFSNNKEVVDRFFNEARAATLVKHAGIVDIFDFGYADDGSAYIVMEFLDGESLTDRIERNGRVPEADALRLGRQAASALAAAHNAGIVHRDLKPDNLFVVPDADIVGGERIKVLDFGIAKLTGANSEGMAKTRTGTVMGSPLYMSPEQCRGAGDADARSDIYAFGCVLYHMLCGRPPFEGEGAGEVLAKHIYEEPPPPRSLVPELHAPTEAFLLQCLAKKPEERVPSMAAVLEILDELSGGRFATSSARPAYHTPPVGVPRFAATIKRDGSTTLSASAGQQNTGATFPPSPARRKGPLFLAGAVLAAGGVVSAILLLGGGSHGRESAVAAEEPEAVESSKSPPLAEATPEAVPATPDAAPEPAPKAPPKGENVTFDIVTKPAGALVRDESHKLIGETPFHDKVTKDGAHVIYYLERPGYRQSKVELVANRSRKKVVSLRALHIRSSRHQKKAEVVPKPETKPETKPKNVPTKPIVKKKRSEFGQTANPFGNK